MPEPIEPIVKLPHNGAWPRALVALDLPGEMPLDEAVFEVAATSRRMRQGASAIFRGRPLVAFPHESVDDIARAWIKQFRLDAGAAPAGELPQPGSGARWTASRKLALAIAIRSGRLAFTAAVADYDLSADELVSWVLGHEQLGREGLKVTKLQQQTPERRFG